MNDKAKRLFAATLAVVALALNTGALTVEEARAEWEAAKVVATNAQANVRAARKAYDAALAEAGMANEVGTAAARRRAKLAAKAAKAPKVTATPALTKEQSLFLENRRIAVSRDTETIPGAVITTWYRNGKPDTKAPAVVTNWLHDVVGEEQHNPLQALNEQLREDVAKWRVAFTNSQAVVAIQTARAERVENRFNTATNRLQNAINNATLPTTRLLLQGILDAILATEAD